MFEGGMTDYKQADPVQIPDPAVVADPAYHGAGFDVDNWSAGPVAGAQLVGFDVGPGRPAGRSQRMNGFDDGGRRRRALAKVGIGAGFQDQ